MRNEIFYLSAFNYIYTVYITYIGIIIWSNKLTRSLIYVKYVSWTSFKRVVLSLYSLPKSLQRPRENPLLILELPGYPIIEATYDCGSATTSQIYSSYKYIKLT